MTERLVTAARTPDGNIRLLLHTANYSTTLNPHLRILRPDVPGRPIGPWHEIPLADDTFDTLPANSPAKNTTFTAPPCDTINGCDRILISTPQWTLISSSLSPLPTHNIPSPSGLATPPANSDHPLHSYPHQWTRSAARAYLPYTITRSSSSSHTQALGEGRFWGDEPNRGFLFSGPSDPSPALRLGIAEWIPIHINQSPTTRRGLFTNTNIAKNHIITTYAGRGRHLPPDISHLLPEETSHFKTLIKLPSGFYVIDGFRDPMLGFGLAQFCNDKPDSANATICGTHNMAADTTSFQSSTMGIYIKAKRDITQGEEILISYDKHYWARYSTQPDQPPRPSPTPHPLQPPDHTPGPTPTPTSIPTKGKSPPLSLNFSQSSQPIRKQPRPFRPGRLLKEFGILQPTEGDPGTFKWQHISVRPTPNGQHQLIVTAPLLRAGTAIPNLGLLIDRLYSAKTPTAHPTTHMISHGQASPFLIDGHPSIAPHMDIACGGLAIAMKANEPSHTSKSSAFFPNTGFTVLLKDHKYGDPIEPHYGNSPSLTNLRTSQNYEVIDDSQPTIPRSTFTPLPPQNRFFYLARWFKHLPFSPPAKSLTLESCPSPPLSINGLPNLGETCYLTSSLLCLFPILYANGLHLATSHHIPASYKSIVRVMAGLPMATNAQPIKAHILQLMQHISDQTQLRLILNQQFSPTLTMNALLTLTSNCPGTLRRILHTSTFKCTSCGERNGIASMTDTIPIHSPPPQPTPLPYHLLPDLITGTQSNAGSLPCIFCNRSTDADITHTWEAMGPYCIILTESPHSPLSTPHPIVPALTGLKLPGPNPHPYSLRSMVCLTQDPSSPQTNHSITILRFNDSWYLIDNSTVSIPQPEIISRLMCTKGTIFLYELDDAHPILTYPLLPDPPIPETLPPFTTSPPHAGPAGHPHPT